MSVAGLSAMAFLRTLSPARPPLAGNNSICGTCKWENHAFKQFEAKSTIRFWDDVGNLYMH